jgi:hypothetical protein
MSIRVPASKAVKKKDTMNRNAGGMLVVKARTVGTATATATAIPALAALLTGRRTRTRTGTHDWPAFGPGLMSAVTTADPRGR